MRYVFVHAGLDRDNDCCAPLGGEGAGADPEPRGCSIPGFVVKPDPSYEPPVVQGERVPRPMGRVPPSKLDSPRGAVV